MISEHRRVAIGTAIALDPLRHSKFRGHITSSEALNYRWLDYHPVEVVYGYSPEFDK